MEVASNENSAPPSNQAKLALETTVVRSPLKDSTNSYGSILEKSGGGGGPDRHKNKSLLESDLLDEGLNSVPVSPSKSPPDTDTDTTADYESAGEPEDAEDELNKSDVCLSSLATQLESCHLSTPKSYRASGFPFNSPGWSDLNSSSLNQTLESLELSKSVEKNVNLNTLKSPQLALDSHNVGEDTFTLSPPQNISPGSVGTDPNESVETVHEVSLTDAVDQNCSVSFSDKTTGYEYFSGVPRAESTQSNIQVDTPFDYDSFSLTQTEEKKHFNSPYNLEDNSSVVSSSSQLPALNVALINSTLESLLQDSLTISLPKCASDLHNKSGESKSVIQLSTPKKTNASNVVSPDKHETTATLSDVDEVINQEAKIEFIETIGETSVEEVETKFVVTKDIENYFVEKVILSCDNSPSVIPDATQSEETNQVEVPIDTKELTAQILVEDCSVSSLSERNKQLEASIVLKETGTKKPPSIKTPLDTEKAFDVEGIVVEQLYEKNTSLTEKGLDSVYLPGKCHEKIQPVVIEDKDKSDFQIPALEPADFGVKSSSKAEEDLEANQLEIPTEVGSDQIKEKEIAHVPIESYDSRPIVVTKFCFQIIESPDSVQSSNLSSTLGVADFEKVSTFNSDSDANSGCDFSGSVIDQVESNQVVTDSVRLNELEVKLNELDISLVEKSVPDTPEVVFKVPFPPEPTKIDNKAFFEELKSSGIVSEEIGSGLEPSTPALKSSLTQEHKTPVLTLKQDSSQLLFENKPDLVEELTGHQALEASEQTPTEVSSISTSQLSLELDVAHKDQSSNNLKESARTYEEKVVSTPDIPEDVLTQSHRPDKQLEIATKPTELISETTSTSDFPLVEAPRLTESSLPSEGFALSVIDPELLEEGFERLKRKDSPGITKKLADSFLAQNTIETTPKESFLSDPQLSLEDSEVKKPEDSLKQTQKITEQLSEVTPQALDSKGFSFKESSLSALDITLEKLPSPKAFELTLEQVVPSNPTKKASQSGSNLVSTKMCDNTFTFGSSGTLNNIPYDGARGVKWSMIEEDCMKESSLIGVSLSEIQEATLDSLTESNKSYKDMSELIATCSQQERDLASPNFEVSFKEEAERLAQHVLTSPQDESKCKMQPDPSSDINQSEAGPITADEDFNNKEEFFQEATGFDFDYLSRVGGDSKASKLARQSLYVKFDPLVGSILSSTESPSHPTVRRGGVPVETMSDENSSETGLKVEDLPTVPDGETEETNNDRLINITPQKPKHETTPTAKVAPTTPSTAKSKASNVTPSQLTPRQDILKREISKLQDLMIQQEQSFQEQLVEKTDLVEKLKKRVSDLESREPSGDIEAKLKASEIKVAKLKKELSETTLNKKQLMAVVEEYEKTISQLITKGVDEKKQAEAEKEAIATERDAALQHLNNMEVAFNDIHSKYEKCKGVIESLKNNEIQLKTCLAENEKTIIRQNNDYHKLKKHASEKLEAANEELATLKKAHQAEIAKMKAIAKKAEVRVKSLEDSMEQKNKEIRELTQICDDLIGKVESA